jgi:hypothetical protein
MKKTTYSFSKTGWLLESDMAKEMHKIISIYREAESIPDGFFDYEELAEMDGKPIKAIITWTITVEPAKK